MGLSAVEKDRHCSDRDVRGDQRVQQDLPPRRFHRAMAEPLHDRVEKRRHSVHVNCCLLLIEAGRG